MQISHQNLANIFFSDYALFFVQTFSTTLLNKYEKQTKQYEVMDHFKIACVNVFTESPQHSIFSTVANYANLLTKPR